MGKGLFITFEGMDCSGKTTQIKMLEAYFVKLGYQVIITREPGGTNIGEQIRTVLLDKKNIEMDKITELLLYVAARAQIVNEVIEPALNDGKVVLCDRFIDSTIAYQGYGRDINIDKLESLNKFVLDNKMPDITFLLDTGIKTCLERIKTGKSADRIECETIVFHEKVHDGYRKLSEKYNKRIKKIDGSRSVESIFETIRNIIDDFIKRL